MFIEIILIFDYWKSLLRFVVTQDYYLLYYLLNHRLTIQQKPSRGFSIKNKFPLKFCLNSKNFCPKGNLWYEYLWVMFIVVQFLRTYCFSSLWYPFALEKQELNCLIWYIAAYLFTPDIFPIAFSKFMISLVYCFPMPSKLHFCFL